MGYNVKIAIWIEENVGENHKLGHVKAVGMDGMCLNSAFWDSVSP